MKTQKRIIWPLGANLAGAIFLAGLYF